MLKKIIEWIKKNKYFVFSGICACIAIAAAISIIVRNQELKTKQAEYEAMLEAATEEADDSDASTDDSVDLSAYDVPDISLDFDTLHEENEDIYAWINVPDTVINYPVLQHPTELDYYLDYNIDHSEGYPGCIYSQYLNSKDFSDFNTVLYGHNMKAGTMFAGLHNFEDEEFFSEHPYVYIFTEEGVLVYEVYAEVHFSDVHLLANYDLGSSSGRQGFLDDVNSCDIDNAHFRNDMDITVDDNLLTLSTCISGQASNRLLLVCVLVADGRN